MHTTQYGKFQKSLFAVYQQLIELNVVGLYFYVILLILDIAQLQFFAFYLPQSSSALFDSFLSVLKFTLYAPYILDYLGTTAFLFSWAIHAFCLVIAYVFFFIVFFKYKNPKAAHSFFAKIIINALSMIMALFKTVLIVPFTFTFSVPLVCTQGFGCWTGSSLGISIVSILCLLMTILMIIACELYNDPYINSSLPWASPSTTIGVYFQCIKLVLGFVLAVDYEMSVARYAFIIQIIISIILIYISYYSLIPYNTSVAYIECIKNCCFLSCLTAMYVNSLDGSFAELDLCIVAIALGIALGFLLCHQKKAKVIHLLQSAALFMGTEDDATNALSLLTMAQGKTADFFPLLVGPLNSHRPKCMNEKCICRYLDKNLDISANLNGSRKDSEKLEDNNNNSRVTEKIDDGEQKWLEFVGVLLDEAVSRYSKSVNLRLLVAYYQEYRNKNYYKSFFQLLKAMEKDCSISQKLAIYRMTALLNRHICADESATSSGSIDIDIDLFVSIEEKRRQFEVSIQECTQRVSEFWGLLLSVNLRIDKMYTLGGNISESFKTVHEYFNEIISIFPDHVKTYLLYSMFLKDVANSEIEAEEYQDKAHQILKSIDTSKRQAYSSESTFSVNRETAIVIISGDLHNLGIILNVNEDTQQIFGYSYNELVSSSVNKIMPKILAASHDKFLLKFYETGKHAVLNKERLLFGQSKFGLLVPIAILIKTMPGLENGLRYISFIRKDLGYIKKDLIKLPYQYQSQKSINFIMTDLSGNIQGISEHTARSIGIPLTYFERKRALFTEALSIKQLNPKQLTQENEEQLRKGVVIDLNVASIFNAVDKDFLTLEEVAELEKKKTQIDVHIQLMTCEVSQSEAGYKIYVFVKLKSGDDAATRVKKNDEDALEDINQFEMLNDGTSSSASSSIGKNDKIRVVFKELKKNIFEHSESTHIKILKRLLYAGFFALLTISIVDVVYYALTLETAQKLAMLGETALLRSNLISTLLENVLSYRDVSLGIESAVSKYHTYRDTGLQKDIEQYIAWIKRNEYFYGEKVSGVKAPDITKYYVTPGVEIRDIRVDCQVFPITQGMDITIMEMISRGGRVVTESGINVLNSKFIQNFYQPINMSLCGNLTQNDKDVYFVLTNGLYYLFNGTEKISNAVMSKFTETLDSEDKLYVILHITRGAIVLVLIIVAMPIVLQVQRGKRAILRLFAEVPRSKIEALVKQCEYFCNAAKKSVEAMYKHEKKPEAHSGHEPTAVNMEKTPKNYAPAKDDFTGITDESAKKPSQPGSRDGSEGKEDEKSPKEETEMNVDEEGFKEERRKKFQGYSAGLGWIFILFIGIMAVISGYESAIYYIQYSKHDLFRKNYKFIGILHERWFSLSCSFIYMMSSLDIQRRMDYKEPKKTRFDIFATRLMNIEDTIDAMKGDFPSNQENVNNALTSLMGDGFCRYLFEHQVVNMTRITREWCSTIRGALLRHGMKSTIFFILTDIKDAFLGIYLGNKTAASLGKEEMLQNKLIYENILVPTHSYIAKIAANELFDFIDAAQPEIIAHYTALSIVMLLALLILRKFFAEKLNDELRSAKGIVSLLPLELIYNNKGLAKLFNEQMNIMV